MYKKLALTLCIPITTSAYAQTVDTDNIFSRVDAILTSITSPYHGPNDNPPIDEQPIHNAPTFLDLFNQASDAFYRKNFDEAIELYQRAIELDDSHQQPFMNLGVCHIKKDNIESAIEPLKQALNIDPTYAKAHYHLGKSYKQKNNISLAKKHLHNAIECDPNCCDAYVELGNLLKDEQDYDSGIAHLRIAHELQPDNIQITFDLANALNTANETHEALDIYFELNDRHPDSVAILYNIAYTLKKLNRLQEAMPYYKKVLAKNPNHAEAHFSRGLAYMLIGDWKRGWQDYEWRWERDTQKSTKRHFTQPQWDGSDLHNKTILLHAEQGLGDTFQFIRFARYAHEKGARVFVLVQSPLVDIINECPYIDQAFPIGSATPPFDVHAPLMSLPYILEMNHEQDIPTYDAYLHANEKLKNEWAAKLAHDTNLKVGICWQGNSNYSTPFLRAVVAAKSMTLSTFAPLADIKGVSFYSLQKITGEDQLANIPEGFQIHTFDDDFDESNGRFMDTAAVIKNLDLVISIDTSICHFAAALGTETWNMLPNPPDWRWMLERTDTPWYNNMHLFRQPTPGDWESVMQSIACELRKKVIGTKGKPITHEQSTHSLGHTIDRIVQLKTFHQPHHNNSTKGILQQEHSILKSCLQGVTQHNRVAEVTEQMAKIAAQKAVIIKKMHHLAHQADGGGDTLVTIAALLINLDTQRKELIEQLNALQ